MLQAEFVESLEVAYVPVVCYLQNLDHALDVVRVEGLTRGQAQVRLSLEKRRCWAQVLNAMGATREITDHM